MRKDEWDALFVGFLVGGILTLSVATICWNVDKKEREQLFRSEAIQLGYAKYTVDDKGISSFSWNIPAEKKEK